LEFLIIQTFHIWKYIRTIRISRNNCEKNRALCHFRARKQTFHKISYHWVPCGGETHWLCSCCMSL